MLNRTDEGGFARCQLPPLPLAPGTPQPLNHELAATLDWSAACSLDREGRVARKSGRDGRRSCSIHPWLLAGMHLRSGTDARRRAYSNQTRGGDAARGLHQSRSLRLSLRGMAVSCALVPRTLNPHPEARVSGRGTTAAQARSIPWRSFKPARSGVESRTLGDLAFAVPCGDGVPVCTDRCRSPGKPY